MEAEEQVTQWIHAKRMGGLINEGGVLSSEYGNGDFVHPHIRSGTFEELSNLLFPSPSPDPSDLLLALLHSTIHLLTWVYSLTMNIYIHSQWIYSSQQMNGWVEQS